jgi:hypothetical protein
MSGVRTWLGTRAVSRGSISASRRKTHFKRADLILERSTDDWNQTVCQHACLDNIAFSTFRVRKYATLKVLE